MPTAATVRKQSNRPGKASVREWLQWAVIKLENISDSPQLDSEILLMHSLERPRSYLFAHPEAIIAAPPADIFSALIMRRRQQEPVAYLTGEREFWSLPLHVDSSTLIPRPETETLVSLALERCPQTALSVADLGTGSGAIALALAHERSDWKVTATDSCTSALDIARNNARRLGISNITFRQGYWCQALDDNHYDLIVTNPPYIAEGDPEVSAEVTRYEPATALYSGNNGLKSIEHIAAASRQHLHPGGQLLLEHGYRQARAVLRLLAQYGYQSLTSHRDLNGHRRVISAIWKC